MTYEVYDSPQYNALQLAEESEAPIERRLQSLLPRWRGSRPEPQQRETLIEKCCGLLQSVGFNASGRQFDGERHAVELAADTGDDRGLGIAHVEARTTRHRPLHEELRGRE